MIKNKLPPLDGRMQTVASLIRENAVVADIGTDHGYLPIALLQTGKIHAAVAADIRKGPLDRAVANGLKYGVSDKIRFFLTDGLQNIPLSDLHVTDIVICGMGGEMIVEILSRCHYVQNENIQLVLQPMSAVGALREYLAGSGFSITDERIASSNHKLYQCIVARYDGMVQSYTPAELLLGKHILLRGTEDPLFIPFVQRHIYKAQREYQGKLQGGTDVKKIRILLKELFEIAKEKGVTTDEDSGIL